MRVTTWSSPAHQELQEAKLSRLKANGNPRPLDASGQEVHLEVGELQVGGGGVAFPAPQERLEAGQQLRKGEGLGEIVVAARFEPRHPVVDLAESAQNEHRKALIGRPQGLHESETVESGEHAVHDSGIVIALDGHEESRASVAGLVHGVSALAQSLGDVGPGSGIVFDDEYVHRARGRRDVSRLR